MAIAYVSHTVLTDSNGIGTRIQTPVIAISGTVLTQGQNETPIAADSTDELYDIEIDVTNAKMLSMVCDCDCTVKTNDSGSPVDTLTLVAGQPLVWDETMTKDGGDPVEKFLSADVTALYVTTGSIGDVGATLTVLALK